MKKLFFLTILLAFRFIAVADEGMWIPLFLGYNEAEMQQMGFHLTADDVYSVNHHSMKDGIVLFGGGCTGELISPDGLLVETVELTDRDFFVGVQYHPEFKSRPTAPHPLFVGLVNAALKGKKI